MDSSVGTIAVGKCGDGGSDVPPGFHVNGRFQISSALLAVRFRRDGPSSLPGLSKWELRYLIKKLIIHRSPLYSILLYIGFTAA